MAKIQQHLAGDREDEWRRSGVPEQDIVFSRSSGIDARDVRLFREFSGRQLLVVVRNPKAAARAWAGVLPPKNIATKVKTGDFGVVVTDQQRMFVSDYDLMSVWRTGAVPFAKVFISAVSGAASGKWSPEAVALVVQRNGQLVSKIQHGCQDDYQCPSNPAVKRATTSRRSTAAPPRTCRIPRRARTSTAGTASRGPTTAPLKGCPEPRSLPRALASAAIWDRCRTPLTGSPGVESRLYFPP